jgi:hypothetical protein
MRNGGGSYLPTASSDKEKGVSPKLQDLSQSYVCLPKTRLPVSSHSKFDQIPNTICVLIIGNTYKKLHYFIFIVAPCILKIHLLSHTNECTNYVIYYLKSV